MTTEPSFEDLVEYYTDSAYSVAYQLTRNTEDAEDIVQDSFVKVWKNFKKLRKDTHPKAWILTIVRNTAVDFLRKRQAIAFSYFDQEEGENYLVATLAADEPSPIEESILAEDRAVVQKGLEKLSSRSREVLNLRYGQDMTFEEVARVLDRSVNTVKSQVRRGLIELKNVLGDAPKV